MDIDNLEQAAPKADGFWIPGTPLRHILHQSHVILTDRQGNAEPANQLGSEWFPPGFTPNTCIDNLGKSISTNCIEMDAKAPNAISRDNDSVCREYFVHNAALRYHPPFLSLLALADAAQIAPMGAATQWEKDFSFPPNPWNICTPDNYWRTSDAFSGITTSQFAPLTPEKSVRTESKWVKDVQYVCTNAGTNKHSNEQENANDDAGLANKELERSKEIQMCASNLLDVSSLPQEDQCNDNGAIQNTELNKTLPQKPRRKKHRPKVITEGKPRTRKTAIPNHDSPKEITKTKSEYVWKNALNTTPTSPEETSDHKENVSGDPKGTSTHKRKYVRRKPPNRASSAVPGEATTESTDPNINGIAAFEGFPQDRSISQGRKEQKKASTTPLAIATTGSMDQKMVEAARKPCRRALNFEIEGQWEDESSRCKPMVNVDSQPMTQDHREGDGADSTMHLGHGVEVIVRNSQNKAAYDINGFVDEMLKDYMYERQALSKSIPAKTTAGQNNWVTRTPKNHAKGIYQSAPNLQDNASQMLSQVGTQLSQMSPDDSNCSIITTLNNEGQAKGQKRKDSASFGRADSHGTNKTGIHYNDLSAYQNLVPFPQSYKKKRTEKGQSSSTSFSLAKEESIGLQVALQNNSEGLISTDDPHISALNSLINGHPNITREKGTAFLPKLPTSGIVLCNSERPTQKRSRNRRARDLATPNQFVPPSYPTGGIRHLGNFPSPNTSIEAMVGRMHKTLTTKKRTKKRISVVQLATPIGNEEKSQGKLVIFNQNQFSANALGAPEFMWKQMFAVDEIVNQMKNLDINRESSERHDNEGSTLVPYANRNLQRELILYTDGTIVPYDSSFEHMKKRRPRPKVELDDETNRVWKLLMESINNKGIDGTDEEKVKWWEEERNIFHGRANSFIARMHLVQGDRRFSPWKGSVVDSVVGVFLTQNVSDHLSSSAFMSLAARFPLKSNRYQPTFKETTCSETDKPIKCILSPDHSIECDKEISSESNCERSCMTLQITEIDKEREVANSDESLGSSTSSFASGTNVDACYEPMMSKSTNKNPERAKHDSCAGHGKETIGTYPLQDSHSLDSTISHTCDRKKSFSENNPATYLTQWCEHKQLRSYSFVELLRMASSTTNHDAYNQENGNVASTQTFKYQYRTTENVDNILHTQKLDNLDAPKSALGECVTPCSDELAHPYDIGVLKADNFKMILQKTSHIDASKNLRQNSIDYCNASVESASQMTDINRPTICNAEAQNCPIANAPSHTAVQGNKILGFWCERKHNIDAKTAGTSSSRAQKDESQPEISGALDIADETSVSEKLDKNTPKSTLSYLTGNHPLESKELEMNEAKRKAKSRRVGNEILGNFDWDTLRKQAEASASKRERPASTMDSLNWEAVRSANVEEIADAIKERGMNNILAGRIKDFLNRLVSEHGSIDLEWLRNVPPDKAKEYLLTIRGLGLKSVECVRLLTLHHLAFPVDTNVGRIAVRLGWVPLQPLPESLQLHLLELYPVLESIQKYLWPRLCKLDQRTLYELHYQMITFGKVFCTKSKPNCNACPMRGECRHFASAFASARLALPGPEQKSIVCATENKIADQNPAAAVPERLLLPQPNASENLEENERSQESCQAKAGVSNSVPIVEEPSTPEPQCIQTLENDIEDIFYEDPDEIPTIKLNVQEFTQSLQNYIQENMELQEGDMSKALVALTAEAASIPMPKLKNMSRLRTEHQVYELPDSHPLVQGLDRREPDDPCSYLLAIWTPGEMADSIESPEKMCSLQKNGQLCDDKSCFSCNCVREVNSQIVRGTLLIPCRTAMRGSFPLNGTYFQVNEVFADHDSSLNPIHVPREWIWNLPRRTVYFGTSIPTIFKGLPTEGIQHCFWRGYVCVRGFDQKTRAPRPLVARLHFPASKLKGRNTDDK